MTAPRTGSLGAAAFFVVGVTTFGFFAGGFLGGRVFGRGGMGFDRLADVLGGVMLGVLVAAIVALLVARLLSNRQRIVFGLIALAGAVGVVVLGQAIPPERPAVDARSEDPVLPFTPAFLVTVDATATDSPSSTASRLLPWKIAIVRSEDRSWVTVGWGEPAIQCGAMLDDPTLERVVAALEGIGETVACETCDDCVPYTMLWSIVPDRHGEHTVTDRCLASGADADPLGDIGDVLLSIHRDVGATAQCRTLVP